MSTDTDNTPWDARIDFYRTKIDRDTLRELTTRSDLAGFLQAGGHVLLAVATGTLAYYSWYNLPWPVTVVAFFLHGTVFGPLGGGVAGHELSHGTVFKTRFWNEFFMHLTAFFTCNNFHHFRASHTKHHQLTVHTDRDLEVVLPQTVGWRGWLYSSVYSLPAIRNRYRGLIRHSANRLKGEWEHRLFDNAPEKRRKMVNWARIMLAGHVLMAAAFIWFRQWPMLLIITFPFYGGLLGMLCGATQHIGLPSSVPDFRVTCRTVILNPVFRFLYWHMNYHVEHHMFAAVPFYKLGKLRKLIEHDLPPAYNGLIPAWHHILKILKKQKEDPNYAFHPPLPQA